MFLDSVVIIPYWGYTVILLSLTPNNEKIFNLLLMKFFLKFIYLSLHNSPVWFFLLRWEFLKYPMSIPFEKSLYSVVNWNRDKNIQEIVRSDLCL